MAEGFGQIASSRVTKLKKKLKDVRDPELIMMNILEVFTESEFIPDINGYYTFIYIPKTPDITYDEHPLVQVTAIERWGFKAFNYHWLAMRNYTWVEVVGKLHTIKANELEYLRSLRFEKFVTK